MIADRIVGLLIALLPSSIKDHSEQELRQDLALIREERGRIPARELFGLLTQALRLRAEASSTAMALAYSLVWSIGLVTGVAMASNPPLIMIPIGSMLIIFFARFPRLGLVATAVVSGFGAFVNALFLNPGLSISCALIMFGSMRIRPSLTMRRRLSRWVLLAVPIGAVLHVFPIIGVLYAFAVLAALVVAFWNPYPAIVLAAVPWLVGLGPTTIEAMMRHSSSSATMLDFIGVLVLGGGSMIWVCTNIERSIRLRT